MAALRVLYGRDGIGVKHHDTDGRLVAHSSGNFAVERFFHITSVEESREHVADAMLFKTHAQVLVCNVESERGRDDGADGDSLRAVVQVRTAARNFGRAVVGHNDIAGVETCTFGGQHSFVTDDVRAKAENLGEFGLYATVHIKHARCIGEKFRHEFLHGVDDFGERAVAYDGELEGVPGIERESDLEGGGIEFLDRCGHDLLEGLSGRDGARRELGFLFFDGVPDRNELRDFRLRFVERLVEIIFDGFDLPFADGVEHKAKDSTPSSDKDELCPGRHGFFGNDISGDDTHQKGNKPEDIFNDIHVINNIKIIRGMAVKNY